MWVSGKWFFGNVIFQEMWFLEEILSFRKFDLLGNVIFFWNVTSQEIWLPSKCDLPGSCWKAWVALVCQFPKNATSQKMLLPRNCDFLGSVTSWELWLPRKNEFNLTFIILTMFATPPQVQYMVSIFLGQGYKISKRHVWSLFASQHECQWRKIQAPIGIDSSRLKVKKKFDMLPTLLSGLASAEDSR